MAGARVRACVRACVGLASWRVPCGQASLHGPARRPFTANNRPFPCGRAQVQAQASPFAQQPAAAAAAPPPAPPQPSADDDEPDEDPATELKLGGLGGGAAAAAQPAAAGAPAASSGTKKKPPSRDDTWQHLQSLQTHDWQARGRHGGGMSHPAGQGMNHPDPGPCKPQAPRRQACSCMRSVLFSGQDRGGELPEAARLRCGRELQGGADTRRRAAAADEDAARRTKGVPNQGHRAGTSTPSPSPPPTLLHERWVVCLVLLTVVCPPPPSPNAGGVVHVLDGARAHAVEARARKGGRRAPAPPPIPSRLGAAYWVPPITPGCCWPMPCAPRHAP